MRGELALFAAAFVLAAAARLVALSRSAVEHFDEGVYASNLFFGPPDYAYPQQRFFAPPLLPALIEAGMIAGLPPNLAAMLPCAIGGCATIAALWWVGRSWFGPRVGIAAAILAALNQFHVAYSAAALTDVLLGLWIVLAVGAVGRSLVGRAETSPTPRACGQGGDWKWAILAGVFTGLAWWTKYNGWLPLAIEAAALAGVGMLLIAMRNRAMKAARPSEFRTQTEFARWLACFVATSAVAVAVWTPFYISLQSHGGYGPIAANHARYVVGWTGWLDSAGRQIANYELLTGWMSDAALAAALIAAAITQISSGTPAEIGAASLPRSKEEDKKAADETGIKHGRLHRLRFIRVDLHLLLLAVAGALAVVSAAGSGLVVLAALSGAGLAARIARLCREDAGGHPKRELMGTALLAAWWLGLLVATPCYWPYSRLLVLWLLASWLAAGVFFDELASQLKARSLRTSGQLREPAPNGRASTERWLLPAVAAAVAAAVPIGWICRPAISPQELNRDRTAVRSIARQMQVELDRLAARRPIAGWNELPARIVYVFGEPALFFQLSAAGEAAAPIQQVTVPNLPPTGRDVAVFLAAGPYAESDPQFVEQMQAAGGRWRVVAEYPYTPSPMVWLDLHDPRQPAGDSRFRLYQVQR